MKLNRFWALFAAVLLVATGAFAQVTSSLTGRVTMDGNALPGVTVTISSPQMQGARTAVTDVNGNYNFTAIPPGQYTVRFEMESMQSVSKPAHLGLGQTGRADAEMRLTAVAEAITVTASAPAVLETQEIQTNVSHQLVEDLPIPRTFQAQANLAPNVTTNSPNAAQLVISGAPAHESVYLVNGAIINENLRSQIHNLFIEDAIQETTVMTGAISAEYGRFTGGVVSSITKSGGNEFSGSIRDSLTNASWASDAPNQTTPLLDKINSVYEGTFGGRIVRDRLWFFGAGRYAKTATTQFLFGADNAPFTFGDKNTRYEAKLTGQITPKHSLVVSYLDIKNPQTNICFVSCYESSNIDPSRELPNNFKTAHYSGIFTNNLLGELNWSKKFFAFQNSGGPQADFAHGTWGYDLNEGAFYGAPVFCGTCGPEERNNKYWDAKLTYYLASKGLGTHNIIGGYQNWAEQRIANNFQSGSNFGLYTFSEQTPVTGPNAVFMPHIAPGDFIVWYPIFQLTKGSDLVTRSLYANDKWDLNSHWSFNLGVRYDKNHGKDASGFTRANDSTTEPRVGATYDLFGNGRLRFNASYAKYAAKIAENVGGLAAPGGNPAYIFYRYRGPEITGLPTVQAMQKVYDWFQAAGGVDKVAPLFGGVPGVNTQILGSLKSPDVNEFTAGVGSQLGRGFVRLDVMTRKWGNFYDTRTDASTGQVEDQFGNVLDVNQIFTTNSGLERKYNSATVQASYPFTERLQVGGNYTYSTLKGNVTAETSGNGPVPEANFQYPEYKAFAQNNPVGYLPSDQRHKLRAWATWALPTRVGNFTFSALERFDSGTPFSAVIPLDSAVVAQYLPDAVVSQYSGAPTQVNYYIGGRGSHRWDDINALDLSLNYRLRLGRAELFVEPELINAFNQAAVINGNTTVTAAADFNPFKDTPVAGVNYNLSSKFGHARTPTDYATMRTYRVSFGLRF
ncbi:MAG TPA: TonB-dependent receptor [Thermoanaerobaculia bacterium]|nr:TonB-dependent receptor [Thermoanaerobaculia bacterium]